MAPDHLSADLADRLGIALEESRWLALDLHEMGKRVLLTFEVLALPEEGPPPTDALVVFVLDPVRRIAASLSFLDESKQRIARPLALKALPAVVKSFGGCPIYGWDFIDRSDDAFEEWSPHLSLDKTVSSEEGAHWIDLFQEGAEPQAIAIDPDNTDRILDVRIWFDSLRIRTLAGQDLDPEKFAAAGRRWWDAMQRGDPRTRGPVHGGTSWIVPAGSDNRNE
jgi:hypothetical protein